MDQVKFKFIVEEFPSLIPSLEADTKAKWGKMNAQQMVEHVADFFKISTGKIRMPFVSAPEHLPKLKAFIVSDKVFRENTRAPMLPEEPLPVRHSSLSEAVTNLQKEINDFVELFEKEKGLVTQHPVFGDLDFEEWVLLHYKHVTHHARQFGLI